MRQYYVTYEGGQPMPIPFSSWRHLGDTWNVYCPGSAWVTRERPIRTPGDELALRREILAHVHDEGFPNIDHVVITEWREIRPSFWRRIVRAFHEWLEG
jgi:hypothetical protein